MLLTTLSLRTRLFIYLAALGLILGSAYTVYVHFDFSYSVDTKSYLRMSQGDMDVKITHRYRIIVPALAAAVAFPLHKVYAHIWPHRSASAWPNQLAFYLVNSLLMAAAGYFIFLTCLAYGSSFFAAFLSLSAVLTSRWALYTAGLPLVDSLYLLVFALALYGIKTRSAAALVFCILIGPHAKESFIFLAPLIFWYGTAIPRLRQIGLFLISGALAYLVRYYIDTHFPTQDLGGVNNAIDHFNNIILTLKRILSVKGVGELLQVFGLFTALPVIGLLRSRSAWLTQMDAVCAWWLLVVAVHVFLSSDVGRMCYLTAPVFAVASALILDRHPAFLFLRKVLHLPTHVIK